MQNSYDDDLKIGDRIAGRYEILAVVGQGSMGVVYKCRHDILGRTVAIKTLRLRGRATDDRSQKRFEREARLTSRLDHPNLISVHDFGYTNAGDAYLVMDFVSGRSLYEIMKRERYLIPERAVNIYSQVCDGLFHAHQRGVIHRDLKPANILVVKHESGNETVKVVDLGVAKMMQGEEEGEAITMTGEVCGSPIYLSPEQCRYQELDARTDIYSLGVCLYESLMGIPPLRGASVYDTIYMHVHDMPRPFSAVPGGNSEVPRKLEEVVFRCLSKQSDDRYETMLQLKQELLGSLKSEPETSPVNVLPPELLFGMGAPPNKISAEVVKPGQANWQESAAASAPARNSSAEAVAPAAPARKISGEASKPKSPVEPQPPPAPRLEREPSGQKQIPCSSSGNEARQAAPARLPKAEERRRSGKGRQSSKKELSVLDKVGMKKIVILASTASVLMGLGTGFGFAFLLNKHHGGQPVANDVPLTPLSLLPVEPMVCPPGEAKKNPTETTGPKSSKGKTPGLTSVSKKTKGTPVKSESIKDLSQLLPDEAPISGQGSQGKYFSIVKNVPGKASPRNSLLAANNPGSRSAEAFQKFKNSAFVEKMKAFAASQGLPLPGGPAASSGQASGNPFMGVMPQAPALPFKQAPQAPQVPPGELWRQGGSLLQPPESNRAPASGNNLEQATALCDEATRMCQSKQYGAACQKFDMAYKLDPGNQQVKSLYSYALNSYALELNKQQHYGEAVEYARKAVSLAPDKDLYHKNLHNFSQNLENQGAGSLP